MGTMKGDAVARAAMMRLPEEFSDAQGITVPRGPWSLRESGPS